MAILVSLDVEILVGMAHSGAFPLNSDIEYRALNR